MSKVTKNSRIADLESKLIVMQTQINSLIASAHDSTKRLIALEPDNPFHGKFFEPEPKLKQLDDKLELTGSDLCRAMLERGDKVVLCAVNDDGDCEEDFEEGAYDAICDVDEDGLFESHCSFWWYVQPINNQGEPLTASEVGL